MQSVSVLDQLAQIPQVAQIRKPAPDFTATAWNKTEFQQICLKDYLGKYIVIFFWPLDFTFVCPTEIIAFSDKAKEFREAGIQILGCSVDSQYAHMEYCNKPRKKGGLGLMEFPLLSDITKNIARKYGCLIEEEGVALRATYIIDDKGILRHINMNDLPVGRNPDEILRLAKAFQSASKNENNSEKRKQICKKQTSIDQQACKDEAQIHNRMRSHQALQIQIKDDGCCLQFSNPVTRGSCSVTKQCCLF